MTIKHDDDDLTPDERELEAARAAAARTTEDDDEPAAVEAEPAEAAQVDTEAKADEPKPAEPAEPVEATTAEPEPEPAVEPEPAREYRTLTKAELDEQRKTLRLEKNEAFKKFSAGEMTEEAYLEIENRVADALEGLTAQRTLIEANEQARLQVQMTKLDAIKVAAKKDGTVDYDDEAAADEFNAALRFVSSVKANASKSFDEIADKAHAMVLAQRGVAPKAEPKPEAKPAPKAEAKPAEPPKPREVPPTLAGMPTAGQPPIGNDALTQLAGLDDPDAAEAMLERMPAAQRQALLRSTFKH